MRIPVGIVRRVLDLTQEGRVAWRWESEHEALARFHLWLRKKQNPTSHFCPSVVPGRRWNGGGRGAQ